MEKVLVLVLVLVLLAMLALLALPVPTPPDNDAAIPKIIHQIAAYELRDEATWPASWKPCHESWKRLHPDFQIVVWTEDAMDAFMRTEHPAFYETYASYDKHIKRIDVFRYFVLYTYGGIYADMDYELWSSANPRKNAAISFTPCRERSTRETKKRAGERMRRIMAPNRGIYLDQ